jgi:hypothetical protein
MKKVWMLLMLAFAFNSFAKATILIDSLTLSEFTPAKASLITCSPGKEIYNLFGHTAIRFQFKDNTDVVFNYGLFSFRTPHFILRFTLGKTDYELGIQSYQEFEDNYAFNNRSVEEQVLNLSTEEKIKLYDLLTTNYLPENRVYRYNFFYDNCSTRPRDKIEQSIAGKVIYPPYMEKKSFRDIIHQYTVGHPWDRFGIDLCLGYAADKPISPRLMMFCPFYLRDFVEKAKILNSDGSSRTLISKHNQLVISQSTQKQGFVPTPFQVMLLLFILSAAVTIYGLKKKKSMWIYDTVLFTVAGLGGCIIAFLMLFSTHPAVGSNLQIFILHPFYLFCLPWILLAERAHRKSKILIVFDIILTLFIVLFAVIPQKMDLAIVPLALSLLVRSLSNVLLTYKEKK